MDADYIVVDEYDRYLSTPTERSITNPFLFWQSQREMFPKLSSMALDILSIPPMSAGVEQLFSQCKIMLTDRLNRLQIDSLQAVECMKSWDGLQIGLPHVVITGMQMEVVEAGEQLYADHHGDGDLGVVVM
jgi:hypothetical protein